MKKEIITDCNNQVLHKYLLDLLKAFRDVCDKNGIWYILAYGTALGAIRDKGFIPWDADVDVCIKLPDVERFRQAFYNENPEGILLNDRSKNKKNTKSHDTLYFLNNVGYPDVHLDIYPLVGAPENYKEQRRYCRLNYILDAVFRSKYVNISECLPKNRFVVACVKLFDFFIPNCLIKANINRRERKYDFETSKYWTTLVALKGVFPKSIFDDRVLCGFEDDVFYVPGDWDSYLKISYGDYMTPKKS